MSESKKDSKLPFYDRKDKFGGRSKSSIWDMLSLRNLKIEMSSTWLNILLRKSEEKFGLEL